MTREDFEARLIELGGMSDGWHYGDGKAPTPKTIDVARSVVGALVARDDVPWPAAYPTIDGGVNVEWDVGAEIEFGPDGGIDVMLEAGAVDALLSVIGGSDG